MSADAETRRTGCLVSSAHWGLFLAMYPVSIVILGLGVAVWMIGAGDLSAETGAAPGFLGATAVLQITLLAGFAGLLGLFLPTVPGEAMTLEPTPDKFARVHAFRRAHLGWLATAVVATLFVGFLPGWVAEQLMALPGLELMAEQMALISQGLADPSQPGWPVLAFAIVVTAPVCEELIFRGYLWKAAESSLPPVGVWLLTSLAFAAYHLNPLHVLVVLPIGLFLGWLRWRSGSIWPSMLAHFTNNLLALLMTVLTTESSTEVSLLASVGTFVLFLSIVAVAGYTVPRPAEESS